MNPLELLKQLGNPSEMLAEAGPLITLELKPALYDLLEKINTDNLEENEHHIGLHIAHCTNEAGQKDVKIYVTAVDADGNNTRNLQELPFELIFGLQLLKNNLNDRSEKS